jgi:DNA mismatch repair ATPase MutL
LIDWLVVKLLSNPDVVVCPHGRPVAFRLTKNELDRHFDRLK